MLGLLGADTGRVMLRAPAKQPEHHARRFRNSVAQHVRAPTPRAWRRPRSMAETRRELLAKVRKAAGAANGRYEARKQRVITHLNGPYCEGQGG